MIYPFERVLKAANGSENHLIELTLLIQDGYRPEWMEGVLKTCVDRNPSAASRYLYAYYITEHGSHDAKQQAIETLRILAKERYELAANILNVKDIKTDNNADSSRSRNPIVKFNDIKTHQKGKALIAELIALYNKLDNKENRLLRRKIVTDINEILKSGDSYNPMDTTKIIRDFFVSNHLYSDYLTYLKRIENELTAEQKETLSEKLGHTSEHLPFSKNEIQEYFNWIDDLATSIFEAEEEWQNNFYSNFTFAELQEELYNLDSFLQKKDNLLYQFSGANHASEKYCASDNRFQSALKSAELKLTLAFTAAEKLRNNIKTHVSSAVEQPKSSPESDLIMTFAEYKLNLRKNEGEANTQETTKALQNELDQKNKVITEQAASIYQSYNSIMDTVILIDEGDASSSIREQLSKLKLGDDNPFLEPIDLAKLHQFTAKWHHLLTQTVSDQPTIYKNLLETAWGLLQSQMTRTNFFGVEAIKQHHTDLIEKLKNAKTFFSDGNTKIINVKHQLNKLAELKLHKNPTTQDFEKAANLLSKVRNLLEGDTKCNHIFNDDKKLDQFEKTVKQLDYFNKLTSHDIDELSPIVQLEEAQDTSATNILRKPL